MPPVDEEAEARAKHWQAVRFAIAVENGDMETVQQEIEEGWIPTYKMTEGSTWSVLSIAANCGQMEMAETFTGRGKNPKVDEKDANGFQALMLAALSGHHDICKLLIDKKAEVNCQDATGETPLMKAAAQGHLECVKILLTSNADPDTEDCNTITSNIGMTRRFLADPCFIILILNIESLRCCIRVSCVTRGTQCETLRESTMLWRRAQFARASASISHMLRGLGTGCSGKAAWDSHTFDFCSSL
eukprot:TRINITY_DN18260_c0_g1_i1.p1 TRINITY_DN18260_c0_g1~~TRINITY_DN18260_c0_g1_i1.p1  ORF type:complete len:274 (-),score=31.15 TRINITY_DN18260_c0_g1_i1:300-1034(-)